MYDYGDYYDYGSYYTTDTSAAGGILAFSAAYSVVAIIIGILMIISMWKIFKKAGKNGWEAIIPIYNIIVLLQIVELPTWYIILYFIPLANIYVMFKTYIELAHKFGKSTGFGVATVFFSIICMPILAFSNATYNGAEINNNNESTDNTNNTNGNSIIPEKNTINGPSNENQAPTIEAPSSVEQQPTIEPTPIVPDVSSTTVEEQTTEVDETQSEPTTSEPQLNPLEGLQPVSEPVPSTPFEQTSTKEPQLNPLEGLQPVSEIIPETPVVPEQAVEEPKLNPLEGLQPVLDTQPTTTESPAVEPVQNTQETPSEPASNDTMDFMNLQSQNKEQ